jgi:hypothetical protein
MDRFDRTAYFDAVRGSLFQGSMSQQQVDGQSAILSQWETGETGTPMTDRRWLAYMLATTYHETAKKMWPIEEYGKGKGHKYGVPDPVTGETYYGRGFVQLTWKENYSKATINLSLSGDRDLVEHPQEALDLVIASRIMFRGMSEGWFTGKKLGQFFDHDTNDPKGARIIINNDVSKNGAMIAGYHKKFLFALDTSAETVVVVPPEVIDSIEPVQVVCSITAPIGVEVIVIVNGLPVG